MPGAMRKMGVYLGLVEDDDFDADAADYDSTDRDPYGRQDRTERPSSRTGSAVARSPRAATATMSRGEWSEPEAYGRYEDEPAEPTYVAPPTPAPVVPATPSYRITTLHPRTYNEARQIGEHFRNGTPVIMNLSELDDADARRLVDFAAGLIFGLRGTLDRVTAKVFLLSPQNVTVTAEDKARIAEGGFFNQS
ncbi:cell division protein SepF [Jatrophihabitans sp. YIM 134969]